MKRRPTITDIAKAVGVTDGTVSRALRGDPRVQPKTRDKVLGAARELGYVANQSARLFKTGQTKNIGIFCDSGSWMLYNPYFGRLIAGLADAVQEGGYRNVFYLPEIGNMPMSGNPDQLTVRLQGPQEFHDGRVDAAVVVGGRTTVKADLEVLRTMHVPMVLLSNNSPAEGYFQLRSGARERTFEATSELIGRTGAVPAMIGLYEGSAYTLESELGWHDAVKASGLPLPAWKPQSIGQGELDDSAELLRIFKWFQDKGARSLVCSDIMQAMKIYELQASKGIHFSEGFLCAAFGPVPIGFSEKPKSLLIYHNDLLASGRMAFSLIKEALQKLPIRAEVMRWHLEA